MMFLNLLFSKTPAFENYFVTSYNYKIVISIKYAIVSEGGGAEYGEYVKVYVCTCTTDIEAVYGASEATFACILVML